uniref:Uncharacterized protein n=1 Tax=Romanomermis culicivorax TaxID=13658 RepID=A0A915HR46_ROMCU
MRKNLNIIVDAVHETVASVHQKYYDRIALPIVGLIETDDNGFWGRYQFVKCSPVDRSSWESVKHDHMSSREPELDESSD